MTINFDELISKAKNTSINSEQVANARKIASIAKPVVKTVAKPKGSALGTMGLGVDTSKLKATVSTPLKKIKTTPIKPTDYGTYMTSQINLSGTLGKEYAQSKPKEAEATRKSVEAFYNNDPFGAALLDNFMPFLPVTTSTKNLLQSRVGKIDTTKSDETFRGQAGSMVGQMAQFLIPYASMGGAIENSTYRLLKIAGGKTGSEAGEIAKKTIELMPKAKKYLTKFGVEAVKDISIGIPLNTKIGVDMGYKDDDLAKFVAINSGFDLALGGAIQGIPAIYRWAKLRPVQRELAARKISKMEDIPLKEVRKMMAKAMSAETPTYTKGVQDKVLAGEKLTEYDTPDIMTNRKYNLTQEPTVNINTPERTAYREGLVDDIMSTGSAKTEAGNPVFNGKVKTDKQVHFVTGNEGSGKSTLADVISKKENARVINTKKIASMIPESRNGKNIPITHAEASQIASDAIEKSIATGDNLVIPMMGNNLDELAMVRDAFKEHGYTVHLHNIDVPVETALERTAKQSAETGISSDPYVMNEGIADIPSATYEDLKKGFDSYEQLANDGEIGKFSKIESSRDATVGTKGGEPELRSDVEPRQGVSENSIPKVEASTKVEPKAKKKTKAKSLETIKNESKPKEEKKPKTKVSQVRSNSFNKIFDIGTNDIKGLKFTDFSFIEEHNEDWVKKAWDNIQNDFDGVYKKIMDSSTVSGGVETHEAAIMMKLLTKEAEKTGAVSDYARLAELGQQVAIKTRESARALQAMKDAYEKGSFEEALITSNRVINKYLDNLRAEKPKNLAAAEKEAKELIKSTRALGKKELNPVLKDYIGKLEKRGVKVNFIDGGIPNGTYKDGVITINRQSKHPVTDTFFHELTHHLEETKEYSKLSDYAHKYGEKFFKDYGTDIKAVKANIKNDYLSEGVKLSDEDLDHEFVAMFTQHFLFKSDDAINSLLKEHKSTFEAIYDMIGRFISDIKGFVSSDGEFIAQAERLYRDALLNTKRIEPKTEPKAVVSNKPDFVDSKSLDEEINTLDTLLREIEAKENPTKSDYFNRKKANEKLNKLLQKRGEIENYEKGTSKKIQNSLDNSNEIKYNNGKKLSILNESRSINYGKNIIDEIENGKYKSAKEIGRNEQKIGRLFSKNGIQPRVNGSPSKGVELGFKPLNAHTNAKQFNNAISESAKENPFGAFVEVKGVDAYSEAGVKLFTSTNSSYGFAVKPDGDLVSVFSNPKLKLANEHPIDEILMNGLENGGNKLDCFNGFLFKSYSDYGFVPYARVKFDKEYAPENWNFKRDGEPDIIFMMHNGDSLEQVSKNKGNYPVADPNKIPYSTYDEADELKALIGKKDKTKLSVGDSKYMNLKDSTGKELHPNMAKFMEESQARDDKGNLLEVYRGGSGRTTYSGRGKGFIGDSPNAIYTTTDKHIASAFARKGGTVQPLYTNAKKPFIIDANGENYMSIPISKKSPKWLKDSADYDGTTNLDLLPELAFKNGYDSVIVKNVREGVGGHASNEVILGSSNQVKDVTNTNPTGHPDIKMSIGEDPFAQRVIGKGSMGDVIQKGNYVYKNAIRVNGGLTDEAKIFSELSGNENVLQGEAAILDGVEKIKTPYSKNIISIDTIEKAKRKEIGEIVGRHYDGIVNSINDLSNKGYSYSDPLQFAYQDRKMKLMDFSNASQVGVKEATQNNYDDLMLFYQSFGLEGQAKIIGDGMRLKSLLEINTLKDISDGMTFLQGKEKITVVELLKNNASPNNVYYARDARMVQLKGIAQTEKIDGMKYVFSDKPLSAKDINDWELKKVYTTEQSTPNPKPLQNDDSQLSLGDKTLMDYVNESKTKEPVLKPPRKQKMKSIANFDENTTDKEIHDFVMRKHKIPTLTGEDVKFMKDKADYARSQPLDSYEQRRAYSEITTFIGDLLPASNIEKFKAIQRIAMLLNLKSTVMRNPVGNILLNSVEELAHIPSTLFDSLLSMKTGVRTNAITSLRFTEGAKGAIDGISEWAKDLQLPMLAKDIKTGLGKGEVGTVSKSLLKWVKSEKFYSSPTGGQLDIVHRRMIFNENHAGSGWVKKVNDKFGKAANNTHSVVVYILQLGDRPFFEAAKSARISEIKFIKAKELNPNLKGEELKNIAKKMETTEEMILDAKQIGLERTLQNDSWLANKISKIGTDEKDNVILKIVATLLIPFKKTPANILDKVIDYSIFGIAKSVNRGIKLANSVNFGQSVEEVAFNQKAFTDTLGRFATGTGLTLIGYLMAAQGLVTGSYVSGKLERLETALGKTNYAYKFDAMGKTMYATFDWAFPATAGIAMGADIYYDTLNSTSTTEKVTTGIYSSADVIFQSTLLRTLFDYIDLHNPTQGITKGLLGTSAQLVPTLGGQLRNVVDPNKRETYSPDMIQNQKNMLINKIPFASKMLPKKYDIFGKEVLVSQGNRNFWNLFVSPSNTTEFNPTKTQKELLRLSYVKDDKGNRYVSQIPTVPNKTFEATASRPAVKLTTEEYADYQKKLGESIMGEFEKTMNEKMYSAYSDKIKVAKLTRIIKVATSHTKEEFLKSKGY